MDYKKFLQKKELSVSFSGFNPYLPLNNMLFPFQKEIVKWAIKKGRACLFEDCGLGKTPQQLEWARHIQHHTNQPVIIITPIAVAEQTKKEGHKFGIDVNLCETQKDVINGINIINYEKLHKLNCSIFGGVVLDESSILKSFAGHYRQLIIDSFSKTPFRLACTATPSPNDYTELGNHAEFLGVMSYVEMLSMFFVNDGKEGVQWRLKKHAKEKEFWKWVCGWAVMMQMPSDLGYDNNGFILPNLKYHEIITPSVSKNQKGFFSELANTLEDRRAVRRESIEARCKKAVEIINKTDEQWLIWCGLNKESELMTKYVNEAEEITGSTKHNIRKDLMFGFSDKKIKRMVTKPKIAGFGMNWQNCNKVMFVGLNDSWEQLYQAIRRVWRFGQKKQVDVYIVIEEREGKVLNNIKRKDEQAKHMIANMIKNTKEITKLELKNNKNNKEICKEKQMTLPEWII